VRGLRQSINLSAFLHRAIGVPHLLPRLSLLQPPLARLPPDVWALPHDSGQKPSHQTRANSRGVRSTCQVEVANDGAEFCNQENSENCEELNTTRSLLEKSREH
jgi:hypothetical protein